MPVGRTIPSTRHGETTERRADVPLGDGDSDRDIAHSRSGWLSSRSSTTASTRLHCRPTVPVPVRPADRSALTPAVAYDGDLVVSRRTLTPVSSGEPTQHSAFSWQQSLLEPQFSATSGGSTHDAKLHFASHSLSDSALSHLAHTVEPSLNSTSLRSTFPHRCHTLPNTRAFSSTVYTQLSSLAKFLRNPTKTCAFHVSSQTPDLTTVTRLTCPGHSRAQATTAYTWRQKINTEPRADSLTAATPQFKVYARTWRAVLTIAALQ